LTEETAMPVSIESKRALRLVEFNLHPARFAHRSWYGETAGSVLFDAGGRVEQRSEPLVSDWLLHEIGLHDQMDWQMEEPQKRLWLLDGASLGRLALELALAMHREWLVRIIDGARLRALGARLGGQALRFVVEEVPEGAFHYQEPLVSFELTAEDELGVELVEQGGRTLLALLDPAWRAVRGRAQLHFARNRELAEPPPLEPGHSRRALELICGRLIPRRFPEWAWCF
jgi:hypothetical protein